MTGKFILVCRKCGSGNIEIQCCGGKAYNGMIVCKDCGQEEAV